MCTYQTELFDVPGSSAKGPNGWFGLERTMVYFDHPVHASAEHTLNIDFMSPSQGAGARVAVELTEEAARHLLAAITTALEEVPAPH
jgi:hypothetical protein